MKKHILLSLFAALILLVVNPMVGMGQVEITPKRTDVSGFVTWADTDIGGTTYLQLLKATSSTITPAMNFDGYTGEELSFKARTYDGSTAAEIILTVSISTNNGGSWTVIGTRTPTNNILNSMASFDLSSYSGTQVKVRFTVGGSDNTIGVGIDDILITGTVAVTSCSAEPSAQATDIVFSNEAATSVDVAWTDGTGGDNYLLVVNEGSSVSWTPTDNTDYTGDAGGGDYTAATVQSGTNKVVYVGSGTSASVTGLTAGTDYYFQVFILCENASNNYFTSTATGNDGTQVYTPAVGPCASESFENIPTGLGNSYSTITWTGDNSVPWKSTDTRTDQTLTGRAIVLRNGTLENTTPIAGGCGKLRFHYNRAFTTGSSTLQVFVNGTQRGGDITIDSNTELAAYLIFVYQAGPITIEIKNSGTDGRVLIDNLHWTCYSSSSPNVNLSIDPSSGSENTPTQDIILTATAEFAVVGDQTITVDLSGTATAADFNVTPPTTITILDGEMVGYSSPFKVVDDALNEGTETAIFTIAGITSSGTPATIGTTSSVDFEIEDNDVPVIIATPTSLSGFSTPQGTPSASQSFTLEGDNLTGDLTIAAVSGYGYSLDNIAFSNTLTVPVVGGNVENEPRTIYVRLTGASIGTPSGTAIISGGGATAVDVALNGEVTVPPAAPCADLFISEYVEGGSNNKYIELYNPTASAIDLSSYDLVQYNNGGTTPFATLSLTGSLAAYSTYVIANNSATLYTADLNTTSAVMGFNGDDALALQKSGTNIDIFGRIGHDPGSQWSEGGNQTENKSLVRNAAVKAGIDVNPASTFTTLATEWTQYNQNDVSNLGSHTCDCFVNLPVVTLTTNTTTATEADATQIVLTASTDVAVTGTQTIAVVLTGTGLTTSDFTGQTFPAAPAGLIITIPSGATSGTLTFNVANDTDVEGTETATFTLSSPSGGIVVGTPNQVSVTIDDNDNVTSTESVIIEQGGEATGISSLSNGTITNNTEGTQVWAFNLYDGDGTNNDVDDKPTIYTKWVIRPDGLNNTVPNWDNAIYRVAFFSGTTLITGATLINPANISFVPSTPITVADGTMPVEITMRITLENTLPAGSDGQHFAFGLDNITNPADVTVDTDVLVSSQLGTFTQVSDAALNGIDIVATLQFIDAPAAVAVGSNFSVTVSAVDANGNVDMNVSNSITLSLTNGTGTLTGTPFTANLVNGTYIFTGLNHDTEEVIEITVHDNANVFANLTANINVTDESHQLFDDFNRADSYTVGVPSSGGSTAWTEDESGDGSKARIENNQLLLTNCNSNGTGGNQYMEQVMFNVDSRYETVYDNAGSSMEWLFNMKQSRSDPSGFNNGNFAAGVILGSNQLDVDVAGADGYGVILGNQNEDQIRLIRFNNGLTSNLNITVIAQTLDVAPLNHFSVKVTYDPCTGDWKLSARDDGSSFTAPNVGSLGAEFSGNDQTYTALDLKYFGLLWNHNNSCGETALFDNVNIPNATSASTTAKVWNGSVNDNWNEANNWGPCPGVPTLTDNVEIPNVATQPIVSAATPVAVCNNLTVNAGATLTINSTRQLTADGNVTNNGTVYVNDGGSFIQTQNGTAAHAGTGNFVVQRQAVGGFNAWSTPVVNGTLPGSNGYWYDSTEGTSDPTDDNAPDPDPGWFPHSGAMTSGQGYYASNAGLATFTGKANNGTINKAVTPETAATPDLKGTRYNLVGNPYPSAISADQFITDNSGVIDGSIYFWDDDNTGPGNYTLDDYATYTKTGVVPNLTEGGSNGSGPTPNGNIGSAQGFFVSCTNSGNITFNNAQRGGSNIQFFRMAAPTTQRLWLSINNEALQLFNQTLVAFDEFATDQKDWGMDALKFRGNAAVSIGAIQDNETYVIATYESIPQLGKIIPLMTYVEASATYTFVADTMEGFDNHHVYLEDLSNGLLYPLTQGDAYSFAITSADEYNRFQLWFSPMVITGVNEAENEFSIYATQNNAIVVKTTSTEPVNGTVQITDMAGRIIFNNDISVINGIGKIQTTGIANGIYAITFATTDGSRSTSQKVALSR